MFGISFETFVYEEALDVLWSRVTRKNTEGTSNTNTTTISSTGRTSPLSTDRATRLFQKSLIRNHRAKLWDCSTNCFARWVTGMYYPHGLDLCTLH